MGTETNRIYTNTAGASGSGSGWQNVVTVTIDKQVIRNVDTEARMIFCSWKAGGFGTALSRIMLNNTAGQSFSVNATGTGTTETELNDALPIRDPTGQTLIFQVYNDGSGGYKVDNITIDMRFVVNGR